MPKYFPDETKCGARNSSNFRIKCDEYVVGASYTASELLKCFTNGELKNGKTDWFPIISKDHALLGMTEVSDSSEPSNKVVTEQNVKNKNFHKITSVLSKGTTNNMRIDIATTVEGTRIAIYGKCFTSI